MSPVLTPSQKEALRLLLAAEDRADPATEAGLYTSVTTRPPDCIGGGTAAALERRGLALVRMGRQYNTRVRLTDAGRDAARRL